MGENVGSLTVKQQFRVDVSASETPTSLLAGVRLESKGLLKLQDDAVITVKNTAKPSDADISAGNVAHATFGLFSDGSTVKAKNLTVGVESFESTITSGVFAFVGNLSAETLTINVKATQEVEPDVETIGNAFAESLPSGAYGLQTMMSTVRTDNLNISVENTEKAVGIVLGDDVTMTVKDLSISAKSGTRVATGVDRQGDSTEKSNLVVNGRTDIRAEGVMARGLALEYAGAEFNSEAHIEASGKQSAVGVWVGTRTLVDFKDHAVIKTIATGGQEYEGISRAVFVENGGADWEATVRFNKGAEIVSDGYAFYGDGNGDSANIYLWSKEDTVTNIVGDVYMTNNAKAELHLLEGGTFTGATSGDGSISVMLDNGARWNVTEESSVTSLTLTEDRDGKSALLSFASAEATLNAAELIIGSGTTVVEMNELPAAGESYITFVEDNFINMSSGKINAVMSGDFNDAYTGSTSDAVNAAANAILGDDLSNSVTNVYFEEGRLAGAVEASRNDDGTFTVVQKANEKIETVKTLSVLPALKWRHDMNDLTKRMGELRTSPEGIGGWARVYGSEQSHNGIDMKSASVQVGADADVGMGWKAGAAFSYTNGSSDMMDGSADHKAYGLAAYGTWLDEGGHFVDLIARMSRLEMDYGIKDTNGSFENNAFSFSVEYGRRFELAGGAYVEPQVEVTWGRIMGDDFLNSEGVRIEQDDFDSLVGRMGVRAGFNFLNDKGLVYARASVLHDFKGESEAIASLGEKSVRMSDDIGGTWGEFGVGANFRLTPATYTYVDLERTTGSEVSEKWRWSVGVRHVF